MDHRLPLLALGASAVLLGFMSSGCGDYAQPKGTGGTGQGGTSGTSGSTQGGSATGGSSTGGTSTGGTSMGGTSMGGTSMGGMAGSGQAGGGMAGSGPSGSGGMAAEGGSGGGGASCDAVEPCGGDVTGTWTVSACMQMMGGVVNTEGIGLQLSCMSGPVTGTMQVSGTFTFGADGMIMDNTTTVVEESFDLNPDCLVLSGTETTCPVIDGPLASVGFNMLTCADDTETGGCSCEGSRNQMGTVAFPTITAETTGTYTVEGNVLTTSAFGTNTAYNYCVDGNTLTLIPVMPSKIGTVVDPVVLTK
jgi:hypothetical protein